MTHIVRDREPDPERSGIIVLLAYGTGLAFSGACYVGAFLGLRWLVHQPVEFHLNLAALLLLLVGSAAVFYALLQAERSRRKEVPTSERHTDESSDVGRGQTVEGPAAGPAPFTRSA